MRPTQEAALRLLQTTLRDLREWTADDGM